MHLVERCVEFDARLGDEVVHLRLEILKELGKTDRFRAHLWRRELYRIQPTFPQTEGIPDHSPADEEVLVAWDEMLPTDCADFAAQDADAAMEFVVRALRNAFGEVDRPVT